MDSGFRQNDALVEISEKRYILDLVFRISSLEFLTFLPFPIYLLFP